MITCLESDFYIIYNWLMKKEKAEILYAMFVYGGIVWWWTVLLLSIIQFIIEWIKYFS